MIGQKKKTTTTTTKNTVVQRIHTKMQMVNQKIQLNNDTIMQMVKQNLELKIKCKCNNPYQHADGKTRPGAEMSSLY